MSKNITSLTDLLGMKSKGAREEDEVPGSEPNREARAGEEVRESLKLLKTI